MDVHFFQVVAVGSQKRLVISLKLNFFCPNSLRPQIIPEKSSLWTLEISRGSERRMKARTEVSPTHCLLERVRPPPHNRFLSTGAEISHSVLFPQSSIHVMAVRGALHWKGVGVVLTRSRRDLGHDGYNPLFTLLPLATTQQRKKISLENAT